MKKIFVTALAFLLLSVCVSATFATATNPGTGQVSVLKPVNLESSSNDGGDLHVQHTTTSPATSYAAGRSMGLPAGGMNGDYTFQWAVPATVGINLPWGITTDSAGDIYASDDADFSIWKFAPDGRISLQIRVIWDR